MADGTDYGKIIVLTGAGASQPLGCPTMASLVQLITEAGAPLSEVSGRMNGGMGCDDAETVYSNLELYLQATACAADGDQNMLEAFAHPARVLEYQTRFTKSLSQLQDLILSTCGRVDELSDGSTEYGNLLSKLYDLNGSALRVFTLNYDLAFEDLFGAKTVVNGMRADGLNYVWDPGEYEDLPSDAFLVVYRLHGCSHWFRDSESGVILYQSHPTVSRTGLMPMVVFPSRRKAIDDVDDVFAFSYRALSEALSAAEVCVVIGCSLRDSRVVNALRAADADTLFVVVDSSLDLGQLRPALGEHDGLLLNVRFGEHRSHHAVFDAIEVALSRDLEREFPNTADAQFRRIRA